MSDLYIDGAATGHDGTRVNKLARLQELVITVGIGKYEPWHSPAMLGK